MEQIDLPRYSKGRRPHFFEDGACDHLLAMVLELSAELAVVYNRADRLQNFLISEGLVDADKLEQFELSPAAVKGQEEWRKLFIERLYSSVRQQVQSATAG